MVRRREWSRHRFYETIEDAEKAVEHLNHADSKVFLSGKPYRYMEYRVKPDELLSRVEPIRRDVEQPDATTAECAVEQP